MSDLIGPIEGAVFVWIGEEDCRRATAADISSRSCVRDKKE
jgi:hypothetical protein